MCKIENFANTRILREINFGSSSATTEIYFYSKNITWNNYSNYLPYFPHTGEITKIYSQFGKIENLLSLKKYFVKSSLSSNFFK